MLLYGPPGLGKTTLAYVIANELGVPISTTAGPVIEKPGDLAGILSNLQPREVLFIDEIHRMAPAIEEILYPAMEDFELDIVIGQGPGARSVKVPVEKFTLVGATTRAGCSPRRSARASASFTASTSTPPQTSRRLSAGRRGSSACRSTTRRRASWRADARGTPRVANRLLRRVRDYAASARRRPHHAGRGRAPRWRCSRSTRIGLDEVDRRLMLTIIDKFGGGPVGLNTLAAATSEEPDAIEDMHEPFLIQLGFVERTPARPPRDGACL